MRLDEGASFAQFVYPFLFATDSFAERSMAVERAQWPGRERPLTVWQEEGFPVMDLLAHVAHYLNPPAGTPATARMWSVSNDAFHSPAGIGGGAEWEAELPRGPVPFRLESARLVLFRIGAGFLTVSAKPLTAEVDGWLDFLHYFRFARGRGNVRLSGRRRTGRDERQPFFPEAAGGLARHPEGTGLLGDLLDALLSTGAVGNATEPWWHDVFVPGQLLPYTALFLEGPRAGDTRAEDPPAEDPQNGEVEDLVYCVRNFFHSRQELRPTAADRNLDNHANLLPYVAGQWFAFSLSGGAFVAREVPQTAFFRQTLPDHLRDEYFLVFLIALHQRFTLMMFSDEVAAAWLVDSSVAGQQAREAAFERIRDRLLSFTARGYFAQVMQLEHHHRYYRKWQETFQIERLYQEVLDEIREMHEYVLTRQSERLRQLTEQNEARLRGFELMLSRLILLVGVPGLVLQYFAATEQVHLARIGEVHLIEGAAAALCALFFGGVILAVIEFRVRGGRRLDRRATAGKDPE